MRQTFRDRAGLTTFKSFCLRVYLSGLNAIRWAGNPATWLLLTNSCIYLICHAMYLGSSEGYCKENAMTAWENVVVVPA
jgi:hypothetical protein